MAFGSYETGVIQRTPVPDLSGEPGATLGNVARSAFDLRRSLDTPSETSHAFQLPALLQVSCATLVGRVATWQARKADAERHLTELQRGIDDIAFQLYGIDGDDRRAIEAGSRGLPVGDGESEVDEADEEPGAGTVADARTLFASLLSYSVGGVFGRWDLRLATGDRHPPELPDPFAPLPVCSPGMLQGPDGLPATQTPEGYPLRIDWDGILVDDPDHPDDIIRRVRDVLEVIFERSFVPCPLSLEKTETVEDQGPGTKDKGPGTSESIEREACEIFGVKDLRDYFRKPGAGGFWDDHIKRYSKSRRKAPIYWLLQSSKKNYALWIYYHRLDKDILFKALLNYVEPKIQLVLGHLSFVRSQRQRAKDEGQGTKDIKKLDKEIERQEEFISELQDFADKLGRAARLDFGDLERLDSAVTYDPDLNDGVVLNIAPLHELVPWKEAKAYWDDLVRGEYEWSSMGKQLRKKGIVPC
jgi:hypothetical protein